MAKTARRWIPVVLTLLAAGCQPPPPSPPNRAFAGLPITGSRAFAEQMGFTPCVDTSNALRCRKDGVTLFGGGPYRAAVDLAWNGAAGFSELTLWDDTNQAAVFRAAEALEAAGWQRCRTGSENRGDQEIWTRPGARVRFSMDLSYWGKRRLRILPEAGQPTGKCW